MEEEWLHIPRKWSKKKPTIATLLTKFLEKTNLNYFSTTPNTLRLIFQINISLKLPPTIVALIMNDPPIMVVPLANVLQILLPKYHDNKDLVLHIR
jgi:hypothetical protein